MNTVVISAGLGADVATITITLDKTHAYVESGFGDRMTANLLREIADDLEGKADHE